MPTTGQPTALAPDPTRTPRWQADLAGYGRRERRQSGWRAGAAWGVQRGRTKRCVRVACGWPCYLPWHTQMEYDQNHSVSHAFLGHTRRTTTSACTANARRERVTAVPAACDSQLHDERCSSEKPVPASRATGTPAGSVTKTSLHPQWSISTSRRLRVPARRLAVHAALEPFGLC